MRGKKVSGWLIVTRGGKRKTIVLQKRNNTEKHEGFEFSQPFPGLCQASWSGKIENNESPFDALLREANEELGEKFSLQYPFMSMLELDMNKKTGLHWVGGISSEQLELINLHSGASGLIYVNSGTQVYPMKSKKEISSNIVLFDDDYEVLKKIKKEFL